MEAWRHCKAAFSKRVAAGHAGAALFFFKQLSSPTWINAATGRVVPPCIAGPKARIFLVSGRPGGGGDCFWTLANTKQPAWGLLQRARVKPVSYQGAEPEVLASWETGGGAVGC